MLSAALRVKPAAQNGNASILPARMTGWSLKHAAGALSLFADRKLIEIQLPSGKPGTEGSKAIQEYLGSEPEDVLLIVSGRIDKQSQKSKWHLALDSAGVVVPIWPVSPGRATWLDHCSNECGWALCRDRRRGAPG